MSETLRTSFDEWYLSAERKEGLGVYATARAAWIRSRLECKGEEGLLSILSTMVAAGADKNCRSCDGTGIYMGNVALCFCVDGKRAFQRPDDDSAEL